MRITAKQVYAYLLERYGDEMQITKEELKQACENTYAHGIGYYHQVAGKVPALTVDDLIQAGVFGLVVAVKFFDPRKGEFWPYAQYIVRKEIFNAIRKISPIFPRHRWHGNYPIQTGFRSL